MATGFLTLSITLRFVFTNFNLDQPWNIGPVTTSPNEIFSICIWVTMSSLSFDLLKEVYGLQIIKPLPWMQRWLKVSSIITTIKQGSIYQCAMFLLLIIAMLTYQLWMIIHVYLMFVIKLIWFKQLGLLMPLIMVPLHTVLQVYFLFYYRWCSYCSNLRHIKYFVISSCLFNLVMIIHLASVIVTTACQHYNTVDMCIGFVLALLEVMIRFYSCYRLWSIYKKYEPDTPNDTEVAVSSRSWTNTYLVVIGSEYRRFRSDNNNNENHLQKPLPCTEQNVTKNGKVVTG